MPDGTTASIEGVTWQVRLLPPGSALWHERGHPRSVNSRRRCRQAVDARL